MSAVATKNSRHRGIAKRIVWPVAPFALYAMYSFARSDLRIDHLLVILIVATLAYLGPRTNDLLRGLYPVGLVFILYDGMRAFQTVGLTTSRVLLCDLRGAEVRLFGSTSANTTLHDYWQLHHSPALDLFCAIPYATFILWNVAGAVFLYVKDRPAMKRFMWGFFLLNVMGFVTYHALPAAPPWYYHAHGCFVDLATKASEGPALARVDEMIGVHYFHGMYSRASSVFGALPSLHCAYPLLLVLEGFRTFGLMLRIVTIAYSIAMIFSAVYLDHHWMLDALLGVLYALVAFGGLRLIDQWQLRAPA